MKVDTAGVVYEESRKGKRKVDVRVERDRICQFNRSDIPICMYKDAEMHLLHILVKLHVVHLNSDDRNNGGLGPSV